MTFRDLKKALESFDEKQLDLEVFVRDEHFNMLLEVEAVTYDEVLITRLDVRRPYLLLEDPPELT